MNEHKIVTALLQKYWSNEYEMAGPANIRDIIDGYDDFETAEGGSYIDLTTTLAIVSVVVAGIQTILQVYSLLKERNKEAPTAAEIKVYINNTFNIDFVENEHYETIIEEVLLLED